MQLAVFIVLDQHVLDLLPSYGIEDGPPGSAVLNRHCRTRLGAGSK